MDKYLAISSLLLFSFISSTVAQNSALSSYMDVDNGGQSDILVRTIRSTITTPTTYFCALDFNGGRDGGGYTGIQDSPDNGGSRYFIFSLWDPSNKQKITAPYVNYGTRVQSFGGEGTGLQSLNAVLRWELNQWVTFVLRRWDSSNSHTMYGLWVKKDEWTHLVTMDFPVANIYFEGGITSFLEDWTSTGANKRRFELKDGYKRLRNGPWFPFKTHRFSVNYGDTTARSKNYRFAYDAGKTSEGAVYYQIGGVNSNTVGMTPIYFNLNVTATSPPSRPISFSLSMDNGVAIWQLAPGSNPQFRYIIKINGSIIETKIDSEARYSTNVALKNCKGLRVELTLEDIYGESRIVSILAN